MRPKVFLDTNVLLDCIVKGRDHSAASIKVLDFVRSHLLEAVVTTQSIVDMAYVDRSNPSHDGFNNFVSWMLGHINVEQINSFDIKEALFADGSDFEDNAQITHAATSACNFFISSDKALLKKSVPGMECLSPEAFVERMTAR